MSPVLVGARFSRLVTHRSGGGQPVGLDGAVSKPWRRVVGRICQIANLSGIDCREDTPLAPATTRVDRGQVRRRRLGACAHSEPLGVRPVGASAAKLSDVSPPRADVTRRLPVAGHFTETRWKRRSPWALCSAWLIFLRSPMLDVRPLSPYLLCFFFSASTLHVATLLSS